MKLFISVGNLVSEVRYFPIMMVNGNQHFDNIEKSLLRKNKL